MNEVRHGREVVEDVAVVVEWDPAEGVGAARARTHGHDVWLFYPMCCDGLDAFSLSTGQEIRLAYESTPDQDGFTWVGVAASPVAGAVGGQSEVQA
ncbi:hypothetical protein [Demequina aestuarii]|uniref:hypothetical protein n=1 Tax=Demequina aestuarii TaxID=327095 RepID=UPI000781E1DC|nr:hypothetical protein [Demequina aestuarii]